MLEQQTALKRVLVDDSKSGLFYLAGGRQSRFILGKVTEKSAADSDAPTDSNVDPETRKRSAMKNEFASYMASLLMNVKSDDNAILSDPLSWWKMHATTYPHMAILVEKYHCITATSVSSERMFSKAGSITTKKRNQLSPRMANMLVFLNSNSKYCF